MSTTTLRPGEHTLLFNVSDGIIFSQLQPTPYFFRNTGDRIILHCPESTLSSLQWGYRLPKGFQFGQEPASDREMNNRLDYNAHIGKQTNAASNPAATFLRPSGRQMPWASLSASIGCAPLPFSPVFWSQCAQHWVSQDSWLVELL